MNRSLLELLALMGRINPAIWDVIHPQGPEQTFTSSSVIDEVALNPQPLPPRELVAAAEVTRQIAYAAAAAEAAGDGEAAVSIVARAVDDFCGTPPGRFPWPRPWPGPGSGGGDPDPHPWLVAEMRLVAAVQMATIASRMAEGEAREALSVGADQLAQAAVGQRETAAA
jgi:hypothetical protein